MSGLKKLFRNNQCVLACLFLVFAVTRFYNIDERVIFGWDQEQLAEQVWNIVRHGDFTLLGPRANNDLGFFLAPYLTYLLLPLYFLTNLYPSALIGFLIMTNTLYFFVSYFVVKRLFSVTHALWFLALWTINTQAQLYDGNPWWPLLIPLGMMLTLYALHTIYTNPKSVFPWIGLGVVSGFFMNMHSQFVFVLLLSAIFVLLLLRRKHHGVKKIGISIISFLVMFTPLLLFDLRHNFLNTQLFFNFFLASEQALQKQPFDWIPVFTNFLQPFTYFKSPFLMFIVYTFFIFTLATLRKSKKFFYSSLYSSILAVAIIVVLFFSYYGQRPSEYYFIFLLPLILLAGIDYLLQRRGGILVIVVLVLLVMNIGALKDNLKPNLGGLHYKNDVVLLVKKVTQNKDFNISYSGVGVDHGFSYLIRYHGLEPRDEPTLPLIQVREPPRENDIIIGTYGVAIPEGLK